MNKKLKRTLKELKTELEKYRDLTRKADILLHELVDVKSWPSVRKADLNSKLIYKIYHSGVDTGIFYSLRRTIALIEEGYE
jgi:hypothetical protein